MDTRGRFVTSLCDRQHLQDVPASIEPIGTGIRTFLTDKKSLCFVVFAWWFDRFEDLPNDHYKKQT